MDRLLPFGRKIWILDALAVVWVIVWVVLGFRVAEEVRGLTALSATISETGRGVEQVGDALGGLSGVPFVGGQLGQAAQEVREVGRSTQESGRQARDSAESLSVLLGVSVGLIPSSALFLFYFPSRVTMERERQALRRLLERAQDDPELNRLLQRRSLATMSYRQLEGANRDVLSRAG